MGGKTNTTTSQVQIPQAVLDRYTAVNQDAETAAAKPFQAYSSDPNAFVAPINAQQQSAIGNINATANSYQPAVSAGEGLTLAGAGAVDPTALTGASINQYLSPYLSDVVGSEAALLNQNNQQQQSGQLGTAISSGAFGGDRAGIAAANLAQQQNLANANIYSNLLNQGYNTALSTAQQQQGVDLAARQADAARLQAAGAQIGNLGIAGQQAGLAGANAQLNAGTLEQQTAQAGKTALYNQFEQQQAYPFQVAQFLANIAEGTGSLSGSTTTTTQPAPFFSDRRLKTDIKRMGTAKNGLPIYTFKYKGDPKELVHIGFMADEVEKKHPEAVGLSHGFKTVDYERAAKAAGGGLASGGMSDPYGAAFGSSPGIGGYVPAASLPVGQLMVAAPPPAEATGLGNQIQQVGDFGTSMMKDWDAIHGLWKKANGGPVGLAFDDTPYPVQQPVSPTGYVPDNTPAAAPRLATASAPMGGSGAGLGSIASLGSTIATILPFLKDGGRVGYADGGSPLDYLSDPTLTDDQRRAIAIDATSTNGQPGTIDPGLANAAGLARGSLGSISPEAQSAVANMMGHPADVPAQVAAPALGDGLGVTPAAATETPLLGSPSGVAASAMPSLAPAASPLPPMPPVQAAANQSATSTGLAATPTANQSVPQLAIPKIGPQVAPVASGGFNSAVNFVMKAEGGYNPSDSNGTPSNYGINQAAHPGVDVSKITPDQAKSIYQQEYWNPIGGDQLYAKNPQLATMAFDTSVLAGVGKAKELLAQSGGDPQKFMALRTDFLNGLIQSDPQKYGPYAASWNTRNQALSGGAIGAGMQGAPQSAVPQTGLASGSEVVPGTPQDTFKNFVAGLKNGDSNSILPLLVGLGDMASSPSKYLGSAILQGLGGGAQAYMNRQSQNAELGLTQAQTQRARFLSPGETGGPGMYVPPSGAPIQVTPAMIGSAAAPTTPGAAPTLPAATAALANAAEGQRAQSVTADPTIQGYIKQETPSLAVAGNYETQAGIMKQATDNYNNAAFNQQAVNTQFGAASGLAGNPDIGTPGAWGDVRAQAISAANTLARMAGFPDANINNADTFNQLLVKSGNLAALGMSPQSIEALQTGLGTQPNAKMTPQAIGEIEATILTNRQQAIDRYGFYQNYAGDPNNSAHTIVHAPQAFNQTYGQNYGTEHAYLKALTMGTDVNGKADPLVAQAAKVVASGRYSQAQIQQVINAAFGGKAPPQLSRYFMNGQVGG